MEKLPEYLTKMNDHINKILATGYLKEGSGLLHVFSEGKDVAMIRINFIFDSKERFENYKSNHGQRLKEDFDQRFPDWQPEIERKEGEIYLPITV
jgi:hypothetical protein